LQRLSLVDSVVFDKTGTLTHGDVPKILFEGELRPDEQAGVKLLTSFSTHPLSNLITKFIKENKSADVSDFLEIPGRGLEGIVEGRKYKVGSAAFVGFKERLETNGTTVFISIDDVILGFFVVKASVREKMDRMLKRLGKKCVAMLSGDTSSDRATIGRLFPENTILKFDQQPGDKMAFINGLQSDGKKVLMVGDGLNDAGALKQADVGIAVTDDTGLFTPGCDGILQGNQVMNLDHFLSLARTSSRILKGAFAISFAYNAIALTFAVTGNLSPLIAAILMPISSVSVVGFSTIAVNLAAARKFASLQAGNTEKIEQL
jgi:Cu+-exporting ATPase